MFFKRSKKKKTMVVGLDGVPHSMVGRFIEQGIFPNIGKVAKNGALSRMEVCIPEISSVSWPTFMTGANPATHGIFGFMDLKPGTYKMFFPSYRDLKAQTIWEKLAVKRKRSVVINQPGTYPAAARPVEGALVSGFVAIDMRKAISPLKHRETLEGLGYRIDVDTGRCREDHDYLFQDLDETLKGRQAGVDYFWKNEDWDFMEVVVTGTDRLQHFVWNAIDDESHKHHDAVLDYYRRVDEFVGGLYDRFNKESGRDNEGEGFFMLSDHGFCQIVQEFRLNAWLQENGFLGWSKDEPGGIEDITDDTKAFVLDPGRIFLNLKGKYPRGCVDPADAPKVMDEITAGLQEITHDGQSIVKKVCRREEIYSGPHAAQSADMVVLCNHGFDVKGTVKEKEVLGRTNLEGMHTQDDAFLITPADPGADVPHIENVANIVLDAALK